MLRKEKGMKDRIGDNVYFNWRIKTDPKGNAAGRQKVES